MKRRFFSLIEMMAALIILMVMVTILFQIIGATQKAWIASESTIRIHENARIFFDIIGRELVTIEVSDEPGYILNYNCISADLPSGFKLAFITNSGIGIDLDGVDNIRGNADDDNNPLIKVGYKLNGNEIERHMSTQSDTLSYEFYNITAENGATTTWPDLSVHNAWTESFASSIAIIDGVESLSLQAWSDANTEIISGSDDTTVAPSYFQIKMTLFDTKAPPEKRDQTKRTFTKLIYLSR